MLNKIITFSGPGRRDYTNLKVIIEDVENHPYCLHGPTLLFRIDRDEFCDLTELFHACSASRVYPDGCDIIGYACQVNLKQNPSTIPLQKVKENFRQLP